ncbi:hypothetical protein OE88DRAFT_17265 [Heliocybe sulcata]|uniref:Uncharacterized protein n=1 Tax=Heliocybe sulcata TaxID=5364 RepID=A0A5C3NGI2_9AGAM|nr:hypothetical protein OE88DRAFT_17265 [Heliocybe sulcata]
MLPFPHSSSYLISLPRRRLQPGLLDARPILVRHVFIPFPVYIIHPRLPCGPFLADQPIPSTLIPPGSPLTGHQTAPPVHSPTPTLYNEHPRQNITTNAPHHPTSIRRSRCGTDIPLPSDPALPQTASAHRFARHYPLLPSGCQL